LAPLTSKQFFLFNFFSSTDIDSAHLDLPLYHTHTTTDK
jgi:hypothetical protein